MARKFKVGDRVRVRAGLKSGFTADQNAYIDQLMADKAGQEFTIKNSLGGGYHWSLDGDGGGYAWREEWLESVFPPTVADLIAEQQKIIDEAEEKRTSVCSETEKAILAARAEITRLEVQQKNTPPEVGSKIGHFIVRAVIPWRGGYQIVQQFDSDPGGTHHGAPNNMDIPAMKLWWEGEFRDYPIYERHKHGV